MSRPETRTALDLTVLNDLDFKPSCEWNKHVRLGHAGDEEATHVGRLDCPRCGEAGVRLVGKVCAEFLATHTVRCSTCKQGGLSVTLRPL